MGSKDIVWLFGLIFAGILLLAELMLWEEASSMLLAICLMAGGGFILSFMPLIIERIKADNQTQNKEGKVDE